jgi:hypothetical protein
MFRAATGRHRLLADLEELLVAQVRAIDLDRDQLRIRIDLIDTTPQLLASHLAVFDQYERQLATLIAARLADAPEEPDPDEGFAELLAAVVIAAVRAGLYQWCRADGGSTAEAAVRRSMATLRTVFGGATPS